MPKGRPSIKGVYPMVRPYHGKVEMITLGLASGQII